MAGRIYGMPGDENARDGRGCRVFTLVGVKIPMVVRVEFDEDTDEGLATVTAIVRDENGNALVDYQKGEACRCTFRTWVRVCEKGQPAPEHTPERKLWEQGDGTLVASADPFPTVPFVREKARA